MDTIEMLAMAIKRRPELGPFQFSFWPEGLQEQIQQKLKRPVRSQGVSTHICAPDVGQVIESFWKFCKKELNYGAQWVLPDNSISITQLWLRYLMHRNFGDSWDYKKRDWKKEEIT